MRVPRTSGRTVALIATIVLALAAAACSSDDTDPAASVTDETVAETAAPADTVAPNGESVDVQALDNSFRPETIEIAAGTEVVFTNVGRNDHNVLPADVAPGEMGEWGVATEQFAPQAEYRHVFGRPGTYAYYCSIHGTPEVGMIGKIVVTD